MNQKRLLRLAKRLESLKAKRGRKFSLKYWYRANCETTACAIGEAGLLKEFNKEGFTLVGAPPSYNYGTGEGYTVLVPKFEDKIDGEAVTRFFDIEPKAMRYLFLDYSYPDNGKNTTAKDVAKRIREFAANPAIRNLPGPDHGVVSYGPRTLSF